MRSAAEPLIKELLDCIEDRRAGAGFVDRLAQCGAARDSVREPGGELLHLARALAACLRGFRFFSSEPAECQ